MSGLICGKFKVSMGTTANLSEALGAERRSIWAELWEAVRGSHADYTSTNLNRAILLLAVPMVLEMVLESLFAVVDVAFVGGWVRMRLRRWV